MEIFARECRDHLHAIQSFIDECEASEDPCQVSEGLYRALHTLSGIAESADVPSIHTLAGQLYMSVSVLQESQQPVTPDALQVLKLCKDAITGLVDSLPDISCKSDWLQTLQLRIDEAFQDQPQPGQMVGLPAQPCDETPLMEVAGQHGKTSLEVTDQEDRPAIDMQPETAVTADAGVPNAAEDPYADMDPELFEVFLEEADEIIESSEITLHGWSEEPERQDLAEAFQRQLHTLKGGARMVSINAIGDLSHSMESLLTRIVDGQVEMSRQVFGLLHEAHDRLAEMLGRVRARGTVETARQLEDELDSVVSDAGNNSGIDEAEFIRTESEIVPGSDHGDECAGAVNVSEAVEQIVVQEEADTHATVEGEDSGNQQTAAAPGPVEQEIKAEETGAEVEVPEPVADRGEAGAEVEAPGLVADRGEAGAEVEVPEPVADRKEAGSYPDETEPVLEQEQETAGLAADAVEQVVAQTLQAAAYRDEEARRHKAERRQPSRVRGEQVRVHSELLDNLVNYAGEINIYRSRLDQQIGAYRFNLAELDQTIMRLRDQLRQLEIETETQILYRHEQEGLDRNPTFDPLEMDRYSNLQQLSRSLMESISDLHSIQDLLYNTTRESETLILQQSRVCTDLQEGLMRTRMIPFAGLAPRLRRIVRQAAQELGKKVDLKLEGADGEMDRSVIENIIAPLEHMLRNAVDHGIEDPKQRAEAGKPGTGTISITFHREGPEIVLRIADDGRGINHDAVRRCAVERGLVADDVELSDSDILHFLLQAGFSTASEVTQISGRGVGMDVVNSEVKQLGGSLHIDTTPGQGSVFTIRLPYTLAINQALMVKAGKDTFCVPLGTIEGVVRVARQELAGYYQTADAVYEYAGNSYRLQHLGTLLNRGGMDPENTPDRVPVLLVRIGEMRAALQVEALIGHREIVVKPLGAQLSRVNGVSGATILGDGRVVLILDLAAILRMGSRVQPPGEGKRHREKLVVMVVDDSITVRKVTTRLLERHGYSVITSKDGVDALGLLEDTVPDMMLLDIEMPRMDGFELATHIRNDERLRHIPITMITSRTGDKHRERASQIGVEHYLGKPYQEHELLNKIQHLIGIPEAG
jgi:chemosensory pili system protein ChpA (sensor histidine kinase/response regulator)